MSIRSCGVEAVTFARKVRIRVDCSQIACVAHTLLFLALGQGARTFARMPDFEATLA